MEELAPVIQELVHACWQNRRTGRVGPAAGLVVMLVGKGFTVRRRSTAPAVRRGKMLLLMMAVLEDIPL